MPNIRVEIESEGGCSRAPASVKVYDDDKLIMEVIAKIEPQKGADGGWYNCVTLEKVELGKEKAKMVLHHDDPPCEAKLFHGYCQECNITPDTQSTALYPYCTKCDCKLADLKCPQCNKVFLNPSRT